MSDKKSLTTEKSPNDIVVAFQLALFEIGER